MKNSCLKAIVKLIVFKTSRSVTKRCRDRDSEEVEDSLGQIRVKKLFFHVCQKHFPVHGRTLRSHSWRGSRDSMKRSLGEIEGGVSKKGVGIVGS